MQSQDACSYSLDLYNVIGTGASWARWWYFVVVGCFLLLWSLWDHMVYKRSLALDVRWYEALLQPTNFR